jgi:hypothetical protein
VVRGLEVRGLHAADLVVDVLERHRVPGGVGVAAGQRGDVLERLQVEVGLHGLRPLAPERVVHHHLDRLLRADADAVHLDAVGLRQPRRGDRLHLAGIVDAVRQQDDHLLLRRRVLEPRHGIGEPHADRGARAVQRADLEPVDHRLQDLAVERQRTQRHGAVAEHDEPDAVTAPPRRELLGAHLGGSDAVGLEIRRRHRLGDVEAEHDVDTVRLDLLEHASALRTCERHHREHEGSDVERQHHEPQPAAEALLRAQEPGIREAHRGGALAELEPHEQNDRDEQPEIGGRGEAHVRSLPRLSRARAAPPRPASPARARAWS